ARSRLEAVKTQINQSLLMGNEASRREDWQTARTHTSSAYALVRTEPELSAIRDRVARMLGLCERKLNAQKARDAMRARLVTFTECYDEAMFHQSQHTGMEPEADLRATRSAARRGLDQFDPAARGGFEVSLAPGDFTPAEVETITARYY